MNSEEQFLAELERASDGRVTVALDAVQRAFGVAYPQLDGSAERRAKLRAKLEALRDAGALRLPANQKRDWEPQPAPALPRWIRLACSKDEAAPRFDHRSYPWVKELEFIATLQNLATPEEALRLHEFFKHGGIGRPLVPMKERAWELFGDEKALDSLQHGKLFGAGKLTLDLLRCRDVTQILAFCPSPKETNAPTLIVENEATFHSFCRLNNQLSLYSGVVFGSGNAVLKSADYLAELASAAGVASFHYFGDLDASGLRIARDLNVRMAVHEFKVEPAILYYTELLNVPPSQERRPEKVDSQVLLWLAPELRDATRQRLENSGRVAQEAIGWERLCAIHGTDVYAPFSLGFPKRAKP
jgi:hypothetical protein